VLPDSSPFDKPPSSRPSELSLRRFPINSSGARFARRLALLSVVAWVGPGFSTLAPSTASAELTHPPLLKNASSRPGTVEITITAAVARVILKPGVTTEVFAYNGITPGPTLEVFEGDRVIVHFRNDLPEPTTVHWHGIHLPASQDGSPFDPVPAGGRRDYVFTIPKGSAGTYWYHPHLHHRTGYQVAKGLVGALIVRASDDPLPKSVAERLLILTDQRFQADGSIDLPDAHSMQGRIDSENGREGDVLFVNGQVMPTLSIKPGEVQRWRVINASAARVFRLHIPGQTFLHIGSDGGLFERPVEMGELVIANSERVELLVRGSGKPGTRTTLQTLPYDRYVPQTRPQDWNVPRDLLTLQVTRDAPVAPVTLPQTLRRIPPLDTSRATVRRVVSFGQGMINNRHFDFARVDFTTKLGTTEIWKIENLVGMDHPFHLHGFQFQLLDRNGKPEPFLSWKDAVNVPKHETVRLVVRFDDFPGKWMFHCHILNHEDQGMMGILEVKR
jgi:FtsP/CotA-like multicopper oxidase with cupredoxin domain